MARFGDVTITQAEYRKVYNPAETGYRKAREVKGRHYYVPPAFSACVKDRRRKALGPDLRLTAAGFRKQCRTNYWNLRNSALTLQIERAWLDRAASEIGIQPAPQTFSMDDLDRGVVELSRTLVARYLTSPSRMPSEEEVAHYYQQNTSSIPEKDRVPLDRVRKNVERFLAAETWPTDGVDYLAHLRKAARSETVCVGKLKVGLCRNGPRREFDADGLAEIEVSAPVEPPVLDHRQLGAL